MRFSPWLALTAFLCLSSSQPAFGQKPYRIAALIANGQFLPAVDGFKKKMAELGYAEGQNITYGVHNAHGNQDKLRELAEKIARGHPDLIVTSSTTATAPIAKVTAETNIPVVFLSAGNPLSLVNSYSSSGNNLTGISTSSIDLTEKRLELLKELAPDIRKVIAFHNPAGQNYKENHEATEKAAKRLGLELVEVNATSHEEVIRKAKEVLKPGFVGGIIQPPDAIINEAIREITPDINKLKLPSVAVNLGSVKAGALATYAPDFFRLGQQGAILADKIFKGAKPRELPIEQPFKLRLVINLATARAIGLKVPKEILLRADDLIE